MARGATGTTQLYEATHSVEPAIKEAAARVACRCHASKERASERAYRGRPRVLLPSIEGPLIFRAAARAHHVTMLTTRQGSASSPPRPRQCRRGLLSLPLRKRAACPRLSTSVSPRTDGATCSTPSKERQPATSPRSPYTPYENFLRCASTAATHDRCCSQDTSATHLP